MRMEERREAEAEAATPAEVVNKDKQILENMEFENEFQPRRSMRRKSQSLENRSVIKKPKIPDSDNLASIKKIYLNKCIKRLNTSLETIYEEPQISKENKEVYISKKKCKRTITFQDISVSSKIKVKKRSLKAKKVIAGSGRKNVRTKISMDCLMKALNLTNDTENDNK